MKLAITTSIAFLALILYLGFVQSLPTWCAHPERPGNWIVQPFCKGK